MMKFNFRDMEVPPDGYRATMPDGTIIHATDRASWYNKIKQHHEWNSLPLADNWKEQYEDQLCLSLPPGWCRYPDGSNVLDHINTRLEMGDIFRGMEVLLRIAASPDPLVDQATAEERGAVCSACPINIAVPGCAPCMKIPNMVAEIAGARTTQSDPFLRACGICKCQNSAAIWIKEDILAKGITAYQHTQYQRLPHCWRRDIQPA